MSKAVQRSPPVPVASVYPLDQVKEAFRTLGQRHTGGKIVLRP